MLRKKRYLQIYLLTFLLLLANWLVLPVEASLQKLDPVLKELAFGGMSASLAPGLHIIHPREPGVISAMVKVSGNPMVVESTGARVRSVIGDIVTADIPIHSLGDLMNLSNVSYIQAARQMQPALLDKSIPDTGADQIWASVPGYTGKDVIVGIIDAGIDWNHPDFKGGDGATRILYIWDQTVQTPELFPTYGYGTEWTKEHIDSGQCQEMDATSHGTHIASVIAGDGRLSHGFTGMAPEANIIVVKTSFHDTDILDAADYIFRKAEELNMPAVINMSFGSHWGAHDGTALLDQAVDELLDRPGRVITAAAGNDGDSAVHAGTSSLRQPVNGDYPWTAILPTMGAKLVAVQIWYPEADSLSVRFLLPENDQGDLGDLGVGWVSTGQSRYFSITSGALAGADVAIDADQLGSESLHPDFNSIYIRISNDGDLTIPIDEYVYGIEYDGAGVEMDAYVLWYGRFTANPVGTASFPNSAFLLEGDGNKTILSPSSASDAICVGSYVTKSEWVDSQDRIRTEASLTAGDLSVFSSRGPLLNNARKPDIVAPGEVIVAAYSNDAWARSKSIYRDREHVAWRGTSMSCPHVAGAIALIYERDPHLTASEVKNMLISAAVDSGQAGWDKSWGYGKLDVLAAMGIPSAPLGLKATADDGSLTVTWSLNPERDISGYNLRAEYWTLDAGFQFMTFDIQHPESSYLITDLPNGAPVTLSVSAYDADGDEGAESQKIVIVPDPPAPDATPPTPPEGVNALAVNTAVDVSWSIVHEHDLNGYRVYSGKSPGNYTSNVWVGKKTEYRLTNLTNGVRVYVAVSAVDASGNESEKSGEVSAVPALLPRSEQRLQSGFPISTQHDVYSSPALYDVDGDGRLEVAVSARDGMVYLLRHDGQNMPGWHISTGSASVSSPAIGDVDGDGSVEVAVGAGNMLYMWHDDGTSMSGFPVNMGGSVIASPALGDIIGDGAMEVIAGSRDCRIYAYKSDGSLVDGFPVTTSGYIHSSAALGDITGDSRMEIVVGSGDGNMYILKGDGTMADGFPVYVGSELHSSPALGDIDGDGGIEIVAADERGRVHAWHHDGEPVAGFPVDLQERIASSPALGDIDGDESTLETVICTRYGSIYVLKSDGTVMNGFPVSVMDTVTSSPALGDVDGDGSVDIVVAASTGQSHVGLIYVFGSSGRKLSSINLPISVEGNIQYSSPALGDLDGDGDVELVVGSCRQAGGTEGHIYAWDFTGRLTDGSILWGGFRHDSRHTGEADDRLPPSFAIAALQNAALKKYLNIYVIASERLAAPPELTVETASGVQFIPLNLIDAVSRIYQADFTVETGEAYTFTASGTDMNGNEGHSSKTVSIELRQQTSDLALRSPAEFSLLSNYPNPFNPGTWIPYELAEPADVTVGIYDISGRLIRSLNLGRRAAGSYAGTDTAAYWDGMDNYAQKAASGVYFYVLRAGKFKAVRKMTLAK